MLAAFSTLLSSSPSRSSPRDIDRYDDLIQAAVVKYWADYPVWTEYWGQLWQESRLDPNAASAVGAAGVAQFMPLVWVDVTRRLGWGASIGPHMAGPAIEAGAYYMATLRRQWRRGRLGSERNRLASASYNAGIGSILKAQAACDDALLWDDIKRCLPQITGPYSAETIAYVDLIQKWRRMKDARR